MTPDLPVSLPSRNNAYYANVFSPKCRRTGKPVPGLEPFEAMLRATIAPIRAREPAPSESPEAGRMNAWWALEGRRECFVFGSSRSGPRISSGERTLADISSSAIVNGPPCQPSGYRGFEPPYDITEHNQLGTAAARMAPSTAVEADQPGQINRPFLGSNEPRFAHLPPSTRHPGFMPRSFP